MNDVVKSPYFGEQGYPHPQYVEPVKDQAERQPAESSSATVVYDAVRMLIAVNTPPQPQQRR